MSAVIEGAVKALGARISSFDGSAKFVVEGEGAIMGVEDHLLALARVGTDKHHPAVAEPDMSHLHRDGHARNQHHLMAPVELVSLARLIE